MNKTRGDWRKSSFSQPNGNNCVEIAHLTESVGVRDSKNPDETVLRLSPAGWVAALSWVR